MLKKYHIRLWLSKKKYPHLPQNVQIPSRSKIRYKKKKYFFNWDFNPKKKYLFLKSINKYKSRDSNER